MLHVSADPIILARSAWENLILACDEDHAEPHRVVDILVYLEMSFVQQVVKSDLQQLGLLTPELSQKCDLNKIENDHLHGEDDVLRWRSRLTDSEVAKIHLARAFIMNPEVLILQRPFRRFSEGKGERKRLMYAIQEHLAQRGLATGPTTVGRRRPRTVFFTSETQSQEEEADVVWTINPDRSISMRLGSRRKEVEAKQQESCSGLVSNSLFWPCSLSKEAVVRATKNDAR